MKLAMTFLATAALALAQDAPTAKTHDTPSRFSGTAFFQSTSTLSCPAASASFLSEDLPDPAFKNRFHVILQFFPLPFCELPTLKGFGKVRVAALSNGIMQISSDLFGGIQVSCIPMDEQVRAFMIEASKAANGGFEVRQQTMILRPILVNYSIYELLIEEPVLNDPNP